jgi:isoquinoline 1-oxidoreductase beta subunit
MVAEVAVTREGVLKVRRVTAAVDVGPIINLSGAENQIQGSIIDGLSTAWLQELTFDRGRAVQSNFHDYPLLRSAETPGHVRAFSSRASILPPVWGNPATRSCPRRSATPSSRPPASASD